MRCTPACDFVLVLCAITSVPAQTVMVDDFQDPSTAGRYARTDASGSGGAFQIRDGKLELTTGPDNTCSVVRSSPFLAAGERWGVDLESPGNSCLLVSTAPGQPNGTDSFGVLLRREGTWKIQSYPGDDIFDTGFPTSVRHRPIGTPEATPWGDPWDDLVDTGGDLGRITGIRVSSGDVVDSITVLYAGGRQVRRGGDGGRAASFALLEGEWITSVNVRTVSYAPSIFRKKHDYICSMRFETNLGRRLALGTASGGTDRGTLYAPHGVIAFCGNSREFVCTLGVHERLPGTVWVDRTKPDSFEFSFEDKQRRYRALSGVSRQSSDHSALFPAANGNDGDLDTFSHTNSVDHDPWWQVELEEDVTISSIVLHNRADCCPSRLRDITVSVLDRPGGLIVFESGPLNPENVLGNGQIDGGPPRIEVPVSEMSETPVTGRVVLVRRTPDPDLSGTAGSGSDDDRYVLSVSEVEVLGYKERYGKFLGSVTCPELASRADLHVGVQGHGWGDTFVFDNLRKEAIPRPMRFVRGDADTSGGLDITDAIATLEFLFLGRGSLSCRDAADSDDSGTLDVTDPIRTLTYLFLGGAEIPPPGGEECGLDPTIDELGCEELHFECPEPPPPVDTCDDAVPFRVLAYNTHLFEDSPLECVCRCAKDWAEKCEWDDYNYDDGGRMSLIRDKIKGLDPLPDVVVLQEVWSLEKQEWFIDELEGLYPHAYRRDSSCDASSQLGILDVCLTTCACAWMSCESPYHTLGNGLVLLSKHEFLPRSPGFTEVPIYDFSAEPSGSESWADKGVITATLLVGDDQRPVRIGVSHLPSGDYGMSQRPSELRETLFTSFRVGGRPYMFGLEPFGLRASILAIEDHGFLDPETEGFQDGVEWKVIHEEALEERCAAWTTFHLGGHPYLFLIQAGFEAEVHRIDDDLKGWTFVARRPWNHEPVFLGLVSFELGGAPCLFSLSRGDGGEVGHIVRIPADPSREWQEFPASAWNEPADLGYSLVPIKLSGKTYILGCDGPGKHAVLVRVDEPLTGGWTEVHSGNLAFDLFPFTIKGVHVGGQPYVFGLSPTEKGVFLKILPNPSDGWVAFTDLDWGFEVPPSQVESFEMDGRPYLFITGSCCTKKNDQKKDVCGGDRPSESYFKAVRVAGGRPEVAGVYQLEGIQVIRDATIDGSGAPAIMMGDLNIHEHLYGSMDAIFRQAGAHDAWVSVHGSAAGGATCDGFGNSLHRYFWAEGSASRLDYVYYTPSGEGWKLVPRDAQVIRDWKFPGANGKDLSDHYPILVDFDLCRDAGTP